MENLTHQERVERAAATVTVNPDTFLSTDYLNHFNEVIMLVEMLPDMPDMLDMVKEWKPKTYEQHVMDSSLPKKQDTLELYKYAPKKYKHQFKHAVQEVNQILSTTIHSIEGIDLNNDKEKMELIMEDFAEIHEFTSMIANIVNGQLIDSLEDKIHLDGVSYEDDEDVNCETSTLNQSSIDALFA